jgi:hypothetical protein
LLRIRVNASTLYTNNCSLITVFYMRQNFHLLAETQVRKQRQSGEQGTPLHYGSSKGRQVDECNELDE